jgi:hypothetical protein
MAAAERGKLRVGAVAGGLLALDVLAIAGLLLRRRRQRATSAPERHASAP